MRRRRRRENEEEEEGKCYKNARSPVTFLLVSVTSALRLSINRYLMKKLLHFRIRSLKKLPFDYETCHCDRGKTGKAKLAAANEKRRAFYKTEAGIATKKKYREKADVKRRIINDTDVHSLQQGAVVKRTHRKSCKTLVNSM